MNEIVICYIDAFTVLNEIINDSLELNEAIKDYSKTMTGIEIWKQEKNYIITENGISVALFEEDLKKV